MKSRSKLLAVVTLASVLTGAPLATLAAAAAPATALPADPWPRVVDLCNAQVLVYQPQVNKWDGQPDRLPRRDGHQGGRAPRTRRSASSSPPRARRSTGRAHRRLRGHADHQDRFPDAAGPGRERTRPSCTTRIRGATCARSRSTACRHRWRSHGVKPPTVEVQQAPPQVHRQLLAGDPRAHRRRAGDEAGARTTRASSASSTRAR